MAGTRQSDRFYFPAVYYVYYLAFVLLFCGAVFFAPSRVFAGASVTIDSHADGEEVQPGIVRISGTYTGAYDIKLIINAAKQADAVMDDPDGDESGTWYYDLDTGKYDGDIEIVAKGSDSVTRYGVWSPVVVLHVDNAAANVPAVTIANPADGSHVSGTVPVRVSVSAKNPISRVQVRVNGGAWQTAVPNGAYYEWSWDASGIGDRTVSIEAKAEDVRGNIGRSLTTYAKVGAGTIEPVTVERQDRAMWIWEPAAYNLLLNPGSRTVLEAMAKDTVTFGSDPVTTLYLAVGPFGGVNILEDDPAKVRDFIAWAHSRGFRVHACIAGGTSPPYMGAYARYHDVAVREIEAIINYNLAAGPDEKFDGVNVDIEPYISPDFQNRKPSLQIQYLDGLYKMIMRRNTAGIDLPIGPAIPKWYDSSPSAQDIPWNGATKWLSEHIQDISDYIAIMDYRDTADGSAGIIAGAQGEIVYAEAIGKPNSVVIGVETLDIANSGDPEVISFREEGRTHMESELDKVYAAFAGSPAFGGVAMHHYDSIRELPSYWGPGSVAWNPPFDAEAPTAVSSAPVATALDYEKIDIRYGRAYDNTEVDKYLIYRSTTSGFTPGPDTFAGTSRSLSFRDVGLLPNTTYYYKVAAMDVRGNIGPASEETSATTGSTTLKPMIVSGMNVAHTGTNARVTLKVVDMATGAGVPAAVHGRFTYSGGRYVDGMAETDGTFSATSEAIPVGRQIGFEPHRIHAAGYYWARAYDRPHNATLYSENADLSGLALSHGSLSPAFAPEVTLYAATVANSVYAVRIVPTAADPGAAVTVNGVPVGSGQSSADIPLEVGRNYISVVVTAPGGAKKTYTIAMTRELPDNADLSAIVLSGVGPVTGFSPDVTEYTVHVFAGVPKITVTPTAADSLATVTVNGVAVPDGKTSEEIKLRIGSNTVTLVVTAQNGRTKTYIVTIVRQPPGQNERK